jgi:MFS transporter, ACDE family, multidrug resistance protein
MWGPPPARGYRLVIVAVAATEDAGDIVDAAAEMARGAGAPLEVVHVGETAVVGELAVDAEDSNRAQAAVRPISIGSSRTASRQPAGC